MVAGALASVGLEVFEVPVDTDRFGTFTRTVARAGDQLEAARAKCVAAFELAPGADYALASEGAFSPWPALPFVTRGVELLLLRSREGVEIEGRDVTLETAARSLRVETVDAARAFAATLGFPEQALFVATPPAVEPRALADAVSVDEPAALAREVLARLDAGGAAWLEADLRAHRSPLRRASLARAAADLAARYASRCPACAHPGYAPVDLLGRATCELCGAETELPSHELLRCPACGAREERAVALQVGPERCPCCNP